MTGRTARSLRLLRDLLAPPEGSPPLQITAEDRPVLLAQLRRTGLLPAAWPALRGRLPEERDTLDAGFLGELRRTWEEVRAENLLRLAILPAVSDALAAAGVRAVALKGTALLLGFLDDPGAREQSDIDLLAAPGEREVVCGALLAAGFRPSRAEEDQSAWVLEMGNGVRIGIELHTDPFHGALRFRWGTGEILSRSRPVPGMRGGLRLPSAEDLFLHCAVHSVLRQKDRARVVRTLFDLRTVAGNPVFSWQGLLLRSRGSGIGIPLHIRAEDLADWFPGLVPPDFRAGAPLRDLRAMVGAAVHAREVAFALEGRRAGDPESRLGRPVLEFLWAPTIHAGFRALFRALPRKRRALASSGRPRGLSALALRYARVASGWFFRGE